MNSTKAIKRQHQFLKFISVIIFVCYLYAVAGWYISPQKCWWLGIASIGFAYLWLATLAIIVFWFKKNKIISLVFFLLLLAGYAPARATFSLGLSKPFAIAKDEKNIRIMQWNCNGLPGADHTWSLEWDKRYRVKTFIETYQPDVICIQDFANYQSRFIYANLDFLRDTLGYSYIHFVPQTTHILKYGKVTSGILIASKLPFVQKGSVPYTNQDFPEAIVWADILFEEKPLRIVSTHFSSMHIRSHKMLDPKAIGYHLKQDSMIIMDTDFLKKIRYFQQQHTGQVLQLTHFIDTSQAPVVLGADLNTVPANNIYKSINSRLHDGFSGSKTGFGNTYNYMLPNLRIDYLLNNKKLAVSQWKHFDESFSDHDHLMADFEWKLP
jgi:endonuclease/exonuclease/phosphatase family metal-dependent hydrolase